MKRVLAIVLGLVICAGASSMITGVRSSRGSANINQATDAAYRDGLFLGQFDANQGRTRHICVGRWSTASDRNSFVAGYEAGFAKSAEEE
jgi:hypothetical protein